MTNEQIPLHSLNRADFYDIISFEEVFMREMQIRFVVGSVGICEMYEQALIAMNSKKLDIINSRKHIKALDLDWVINVTVIRIKVYVKQ